MPCWWRASSRRVLDLLRDAKCQRPRYTKIQLAALRANAHAVVHVPRPPTPEPGWLTSVPKSLRIVCAEPRFARRCD